MNQMPLQIDLQAIINDRVPRKKRRFVPNALIRLVEKIICQDQLNAILRDTHPHEGVAFADALLRHLNISIEVIGRENIPSHGRFIFASNHPLGGLDGISLIKVLGDIYGPDGVRFLVNDILMNVRPLRSVFLPINKYGSQGRAAAELINQTYASDTQMIIFPAGLVSRRHKGGEIKDLQWQKAFIAKAIEHERDIIPIYFEGLNSSFFYNFAHWRKRSGLKINIEQALLPSELVKARDKHFRIHIGRPVGWQSLKQSDLTPIQLADDIKAAVYDLPQQRL